MGNYELVSRYVKWTRCKIDKFENSTLSLTLRVSRLPDTSDGEYYFVEGRGPDVEGRGARHVRLRVLFPKLQCNALGLSTYTTASLLIKGIKSHRHM